MVINILSGGLEVSERNNKEVEFIYTCSSVKGLVNQLERSLKGLLEYVKPEKVVVFFTPPVEDTDVERLEGHGVDVRIRENFVDKKVSSDNSDIPSHYGDKYYLTTVDADTVVFLDCDTRVLGDI